MNKPLVSICCITYNHEQFIAQALEGFVMQQTNFEFEIVISNDCSSDATQSIINTYKIQYPHLFKDISPPKNLGMMANFKHTLEACAGKYIALCEGDDFWTDSLKLQKQVDFLEANDEYVMCFHKTKCNDLIKRSNDFDYVGYYGNNEKDFTIQDFFYRNYAATASVVFEKQCVTPFLQKIEKFPIGDYFIYVTILFKSGKKAKYIPDCMAIYTNHWGGHGKTNGMDIYYKSMIVFFRELQLNILHTHFKKECTEQLKRYSKNLYHEFQRKGKYFQAVKYMFVYLLFKLKSFSHN